MNKNDLVDALVPRLGDRAAAALAVEAFVDVVLREVADGGTVGITGFGTFEPVDRAPRTGRNPHTGAAVPIPATRSPRFRPGSYFKAVVADPEQLPADGLAGARVGSVEDADVGSPSREDGSGRHGIPATIRREATAGKSREDTDPTVRTTKKGAARRRTGTPSTVRAEQPEPARAPTTEPGRQPGSGGRMTMGGEQITLEMITAKKAALARAKNDPVTEERASSDGTKGGREKRGKADRKSGKDKKKAKGKKGKKS